MSNQPVSAYVRMCRMKPAVLARRLEPLLPCLRCPRCLAPFSLSQTSLICENHHCYDLSRRGYVNLAPGHDQAQEKYSATLFDSRRTVFDGGFYEPVMEAVASRLKDEGQLILDVGCGEGWYARRLSERFPSLRMIGLDLSRDAITAAAQTPGAAHYLVADLKHLPFADHSADVIVDVLTPADYAEFRRVLKPGGLLIKVIPGAEYLSQVRHAVAPHLRSGDSYDNARVLEHLKQNAEIIHETEIRQTSPLTADQSAAFLRMTPMTFSVPEEVLRALSVSEITIHMHVFVCKLG